MNLNELPLKSKIFIDANIFIYHFTGVSDQCSDLLRRCEKKEVEGFSSINVFMEVLHRLMMVELVAKNLLKPPNLLRKLQKRPDLIKELDDYFENTRKIPEMGINLLPVEYQSFLKSHLSRKEHGLLVNDSLIIALMKANKLKTLASNDEAFYAVRTIDVYKPDDLRL